MSIIFLIFIVKYNKTKKVSVIGIERECCAMKCEKLEKCPFYLQKMSMDSGLGAIYRKNYCESNKEKCARYLVATKLGPQYVPTDLYPNMQQRAKDIISSKLVSVK